MDAIAPPQPEPELLDIDGNPVPKDGRTGFIETPDGARLRYALWKPTQRPNKGTVILLQGRAEFIEKYFETVGELRARGFHVVTFDWRGQGGSSRLLGDPTKGHIDHFNQYLTDLDTILTEVALPDCPAPFYFLAHSMGGLIALLAAPALGNRVRRMVLLGPLLSLRNLPISQESVARIAGFLSIIGFGRTSISWGKRSLEQRAFVGNNLTSDTVRFNRNGELLSANPGLGLSSPTVSWIFAACRAMARLKDPEFAGTIGIPTLLIAAGNDPIISPQAIERFGNRMRSGAFLTIFGAKHELLQERDIFREQTLSAFDAFVPGTEI
mgnify:CR=1 FL=1